MQRFPQMQPHLAIAALATLCVAAAPGARQHVPPPPERIDHPSRPQWPTWKREAHALSLVKDEQVLWRFNYDPQQGKPSFHPLAMPGGEPMTAFGPADHPWHRGLWFSWKYLNGVNYWEEDRTTGRADGATTWSGVDITTSQDGEAELRMALSYAPQGGDAVLKEDRRIVTTPPGADGSFALDWSSTFIALKSDVVFERTPLPDEPGGQAWGGYAGLSLRFALDMQERHVESTDGPASFNAENRHRGKARAMDYSGKFAANPNVTGVAIFDHPENLNAPTPWYVIKSEVMSFFTPAVICYGPHTLPAGESLTLRYRVYVHPGRWDAAKLREEWEAYLEAVKQREREEKP